VNNKVIPRNEWNTHKLNENDSITIIRATQGG
jgi:thiamine biosynthesis protein ThiS